MRILLSFFISAFIVVSLFYMIIGLIHQDTPPLEMEEKIVQVNIENVKKEAPEQEAKSRKKKINEPDPNLIHKIQPTINHDLNNLNQPLINMSMTPTEFKFKSSNIPKLQENWIQPTAPSQIDAQALGEQIGSKPKTLRKITPMTTRKPQIPKIAWENKINGWVTVSIEVTPSGFTENIQVIDASPRGVFEDEAVATVKHWRYQSQDGENRKLLQKIEFQWKDYPYNWE
ncbi:hypothetical protein NBRC116188_23800 [Oceaniserpentilla sp. 4NH20-0058]|uniref:energy transducer TonB n=1 Tax=Oceaniserpentilla sp. 4NH20-0058 TaxID=3127660 RepID=UPI00310BBA07